MLDKINVFIYRVVLQVNMGIKNPLWFPKVEKWAFQNVAYILIILKIDQDT